MIGRISGRNGTVVSLQSARKHPCLEEICSVFWRKTYILLLNNLIWVIDNFRLRVPSFHDGPHRIYADPQPLRYFFCGASLGI